MGMFQSRNPVFHNGTTTTGNGEELIMQSGEQVLQVEISSIGTATVAFEAMGVLNAWRPLIGFKQVATMDVLTETSDLVPFYQFDVVGLSKIRMRISANSGSPVYISGKIVG